ncbi:hypothetical protein ACLMJK_008288 [Lecanora helva]
MSDQIGWLREATVNDTGGINNVFLAAMPDCPSWNYRFPYREQYPEDHQKYNKDLIRRFLSPEYEDWVVIVIDDKDPASDSNKVVAFAIWDIAYCNRRRYGNDYKSTSPAQDTFNAGGSSRKDADPKHMAAFRKGLAESKERYFAAFDTERMNLQILATLPAFRHRGYATHLVRWGMNKARDDEVFLTLNASPQGSTLYRSLGFHVLGSQRSQVPGEEEFIEDTAMVDGTGFNSERIRSYFEEQYEEPSQSIPHALSARLYFVATPSMATKIHNAGRELLLIHECFERFINRTILHRPDATSTDPTTCLTILTSLW